MKERKINNMKIKHPYTTFDKNIFYSRIGRTKVKQKQLPTKSHTGRVVCFF